MSVFACSTRSRVWVAFSTCVWLVPRIKDHPLPLNAQGKQAATPAAMAPGAAAGKAAEELSEVPGMQTAETCKICRKPIKEGQRSYNCRVCGARIHALNTCITKRGAGANFACKKCKPSTVWAIML